MTSLFKRAVRITLATQVTKGGVVTTTEHVIENLRVQFKVKQTLGKEPNPAQLTIYNLSESSRGALQSVGTTLIIEAGYEGTLAQLFKGKTTFIDHTHEGPDWVTRVQVSDGSYALGTHVKGSHKKGTAVSAVFESVAKQLKEKGIDVDGAVNKVKQLITDKFSKGATVGGKATHEIAKLLDGRLDWSIQDEKLQVLEIGKALTNDAVVLSSSTGLIGSPVHGSPPSPKAPSPLTVKSLLQPSLRPGRKVRLESLAVKGDFRCGDVTHTGDTAQNDWYSESELTAL